MSYAKYIVIKNTEIRKKKSINIKDALSAIWEEKNCIFQKNKIGAQLGRFVRKALSCKLLLFLSHGEKWFAEVESLNY